MRDKRFLTIGPEIDGLRRLSGLLDPESAAIVIGAVDAVTAPRRGGPRFVDPEQQARARAIVDDERTHGQLVLDSVVE
ncbi:MAG TPA: HNH endonuclease, partial [Diaminobutyricibacter sp.]